MEIRVTNVSMYQGNNFETLNICITINENIFYLNSVGTQTFRTQYRTTYLFI